MGKFRDWFLCEAMITVYRGTGPQGVKELRPSEEGAYGPGIYFYDNLQSASVYAEPGGGVVVAQVDSSDPQVKVVDKNVSPVGMSNVVLRKERIVVVPDASKVRVIQVIPTNQT